MEPGHSSLTTQLRLRQQQLSVNQNKTENRRKKEMLKFDHIFIIKHNAEIIKGQKNEPQKKFLYFKSIIKAKKIE
jgi:hypothetical protein